LVEGTYAGVPTCQVEMLDVKLPGIDVLNPGKMVRTTAPAENGVLAVADPAKLGASFPEARTAREEPPSAEARDGVAA
jgi:hypothetical protein